VLPVLITQAPAAPLLAILPPPLPTPARPTPPSGTSAVSSPVEAPEKEEEEEGATESVSNQAVAYRASEHDSPPVYLLSFIVLAALAGASVRRRPRRGRRVVRVAPATTNAARWQERASRRGRDERSR
jgi:septal ring-binding cell division protein DamX